VHPTVPLTIATLLFGLGLYGVLARRNAVLVLMAVELMLNAVTLLFVTLDVTLPGDDATGQVAALFVIVLAAAEIGVGLAVVLALYRARRTVALDDLDDLDDPDAAGDVAAATGSGAAGGPGAAGDLGAPADVAASSATPGGPG